MKKIKAQILLIIGLLMVSARLQATYSIYATVKNISCDTPITVTSSGSIAQSGNGGGNSFPGTGQTVTVQPGESVGLAVTEIPQLGPWIAGNFFINGAEVFNYTWPGGQGGDPPGMVSAATTPDARMSGDHPADENYYWVLLGPQGSDFEVGTACCKTQMVYNFLNSAPYAVDVNVYDVNAPSVVSPVQTVAARGSATMYLEVNCNDTLSVTVLPHTPTVEVCQSVQNNTPFAATYQLQDKQNPQYVTQVTLQPGAGISLCLNVPVGDDAYLSLVGANADLLNNTPSLIYSGSTNTGLQGMTGQGQGNVGTTPSSQTPQNNLSGNGNIIWNGATDTASIEKAGFNGVIAEQKKQETQMASIVSGNQSIAGAVSGSQATATATGNNIVAAINTQGTKLDVDLRTLAQGLGASTNGNLLGGGTNDISLTITNDSWTNGLTISQYTNTVIQSQLAETNLLVGFSDLLHSVTNNNPGITAQGYADVKSGLVGMLDAHPVDDVGGGYAGQAISLGQGITMTMLDTAVIDTVIPESQKARSVVAWVIALGLLLVNWNTIYKASATAFLVPQSRTSGTEIMGTNINMTSAFAMAALIVGVVASLPTIAIGWLLDDVHLLALFASGGKGGGLTSMSAFSFADHYFPIGMLVSALTNHVLVRMTLQPIALTICASIKFFVGV